MREEIEITEFYDFAALLGHRANLNYYCYVLDYAAQNGQKIAPEASAFFENVAHTLYPLTPWAFAALADLVRLESAWLRNDADKSELALSRRDLLDGVLGAGGLRSTFEFLPEEAREECNSQFYSSTLAMTKLMVESQTDINRRFRELE